jgi:LysR family transcriptional regulator (chromosome initiation inhibitor)
MLDYASLMAVAMVVREGSFERAARALNVTPSAISQRIKALEERLGGVLIVRGQPCIATETGRLLCRHAEQVGMLEQDLRRALPRLATANPVGERVPIRVAVNADSLGTWFIGALAMFLEADEALVDIALDDQEHTHNWLRTGDVQAAVTANAKPVQGCNSIALGRLNYVAVASPAFVKRHFPNGVNATYLGKAPSLCFNRKDRLQAQWVRSICRRNVDVPAHWFPSTQAFIDASVAGIGWGMNPLSLVETHLQDGRLVELVPGRVLAVPLYWQHTRLQMPMLSRLTQTVVAAARAVLQSTAAALRPTRDHTVATRRHP